MATISVQNVNKRAPVWFVKIKRVVNLAIMPALIITLKALWEGSEEGLNKVMVVITVALPAVLEATGMLLAPDPVEIDSDRATFTAAAPNDQELKNKVV